MSDDLPDPDPTPAGLFDLTGRTVLLTGATGWLGAAMTSALAGAGADVTAVARDESRLAELAATQERAGHPVRTASVDVTTPSWPELVEEVAERTGRLDVLVNNAHLGRGDSLRTATTEAYEQAWQLAVVAASVGMNAARAGFAASVAAGGRPTVINVASMYGMVSPDPGLYENEAGRNPPYYGAAKAALLQLTRYAAAELGESGVRVNAITPGPFPQHPDRMDPAFVDRLAGRTMLKRIGSPDDLRTAVLFLASPNSAFVTGANLVVDGGWTAW